MRLTIEQFRLAFPAFTENLYPDEAVNFRLILADKFFSEELWIDSDVRDHAMGLFTGTESRFRNFESELIVH